MTKYEKLQEHLKSNKYAWLITPQLSLCGLHHSSTTKLFISMVMVKPAVIFATLIIVFRQISWQPRQMKVTPAVFTILPLASALCGETYMTPKI